MGDTFVTMEEKLRVHETCLKIVSQVQKGSNCHQWRTGKKCHFTWV